jgi:hypothetical protein
MSATQSRRAARNCAALRGGKDIQTGTGASGIVGGNDAAEETSRIFAKLGVDKSVGNLIQVCPVGILCNCALLLPFRLSQAANHDHCIKCDDRYDANCDQVFHGSSPF